MLNRFITILSFLILSISSTYCYYYYEETYYDSYCYSFTNANNELIPEKLCKYGDGYYCCGTCNNRKCCNDTVQFLHQKKDCDKKPVSLIVLVFAFIPAMACCCCFILCCIFFMCKNCFGKCLAKKEVNPMENSNPVQVPSRISSARRISKPSLNSIQPEILPAYNMAIKFDPNLPSYESIVSNKESKFKTTQA